MNTACCNRYEKVQSRREFLERSAFGFGALALAHLLEKDSVFGSVFPDNQISTAINPLAAKPLSRAAKAKSVVLIFMQGGPSHMDTFDPKPVLNQLDGQLLPPSFQAEGLNLQNLKASEAKLMGSRFAFKKYGKSGLEISDFCHPGSPL